MERSIQIKDYIASLFAVEDAMLAEIRENSKREGLPDIHVPANVGKLLYCLTKIKSPKRVLEIGTLAGYSTLWIARALAKEAKLITIEGMPKHAALARSHLDKAGVGKQVEIRIGNALQELAKLEGSFDLIFIDADKESYTAYLDWAVRLSHSGTLILSDNLIPKGETIGKPVKTELEAQAIYAFNQAMAAHPQLESVLAPTVVGDKGRIDALGIAIVR